MFFLFSYKGGGAGAAKGSTLGAGECAHLDRVDRDGGGVELGVLVRRRVEVQDVEQVQDPDAEGDHDEEHREVDEVEHVPRAREVPVSRGWCGAG